MTSTANQQNIPASNPIIATTAASYASAASASKKPAVTPVIATGSQPPIVVGSAAPTPQHAKSSSVSPMNGSKPMIMPAVPTVSPAPAVAHGSSSTINGNSADHSRKSSVTISANYVANGGPVGPKAPMPQFGFKESPAIAHSTPQQPTPAPIPIPNARVPSPAHSPSPIPQPSASGGRPPSTIPQDGPAMKFGSLGGDGERHMKHLPAMSQNSISSPHLRHGSTHSVHSEMGTHGGQGPNRGGYQPQGGRGRGYNNNNNPFPNQTMPYQQPGQYRGPPSQGRGGMQGFPRGPIPTYQANSPTPSRGSPAMTPSIPNNGTPHMGQSIPVPNAGLQYAPPPMGYPQTYQVNPPPSSQEPAFSNKSSKKKGGRRDAERFSQHPRQCDSSLKPLSRHDLNGKSRRYSKRWETIEELKPQSSAPLASETTNFPIPAEQAMQPPLLFSRFSQTLDDLSPASGNFDRLLTARKQNYPYPPHFDPMRQAPMNMGVAGYSQMHPYFNASQSPSPGFSQGFASGQYPPPPGPQPMSRNSSHSERPNSSTGQGVQPPAIVQGGSQPNPSLAKPAIVSSNPRSGPRKSAAIMIKNPQSGEVLDLSGLKAPASPVPVVQKSKTPPVVASTPTPPPPKAPTPSHARSESTSASKTAEQLRKEEQIRKEFEEKVRKKTATEAPEVTKDDEVEQQATAETAEDEEPPKVEQKAAEETKALEAKTKEAADAKEKATSEAATPAAPEPQPAQPEAPADEEDDLERQIREIEEAEAKEAAAQAAYEEKKKAREAEEKKRAEAQRLANAADEDRKLQEQEREMERLEDERERKRKENEAKAEADGKNVTELLKERISDIKSSDKDKKESPTTPTPESVAGKLADLKISNADIPSSASSADTATSKASTEKQKTKPSALNLTPLNTKTVEPPQPSAALQSLKTARFLSTFQKDMYPSHINSPNPAINSAVSKKGNFRYDPNFLLQFKTVFTEKPSEDFDQQVRSLIGDGDGGSRSAVRTPAGTGSGRQGSRTAVPAFPAMGSFGAGKTLPPGTTSEQRFNASNMARHNMPPMASFRPGGAFPGPSQMSRTPSSSNMGGMPHSPRQGSRSTRGNSKRDNYSAKAEAQAAKIMPLTQGQDLKPISVTASGWKPTSIGNRTAQNPTAVAGQGGLLDPAMVQRKVKAALNKMTPEKFEKISGDILTIALQSKDEEDGRTLRQVIQLTFEKATDEAHWAGMYAKFCKRMLEMMSPDIRDTTILDKNGNVVSGGALFRKYLLNRCQEEFERGWSIDLPKPKEGESKEAVMLSDEYYLAAAAKRRGLGLVQFIGELYKLGMLTERIMHECVRKLVDYQGTPDEAEIESLSKLLRTIGANLDNTEKGKPMMDAYFARIQNIIDLPDLPSRLQFMLMDVVDLRRVNWVSSEQNKGPKTLEEVRQEAEAAAARKAAENARNSQRGPAGGRPPIGRGDGRQFSLAPNQVGMDDLRRLKGSAGRTATSSVTLGPTSMFASRSNSGRRLGGPGGSLGRAGEDSGASSRTGTPPTRDPASHSNAFHVLANMETENPASPPSTAASPALSKAVPDTSGASSSKKDSD